ncbi:MAG: tRNA (N6-isopentenyl adenosine(37)-C2)-methylthiotransferase MiaB [Anaerolineae bacterium]|nr:tRNA (N6-isopentenyl adenosine(37)-C2)-methylthiotransferase MiaB [Anaerolineae bacterium]MDW8098098.1 tRNA (N6-isopentenyl adenosine(37)-C2)-methylthiotransferase MiaB [Anaerolineae bacterium]
MRTKRYHIWTIGCQMNEADSAHVAARLEALGYEPTSRADQADVIVLNTCVVRQSAEDKAIGHLNSLKPLKQRRPETTIALMGCLVGIKPSPKLRERFPFVDVFMPPSEPGPLVAYLTGQALDTEAAAVERAETERRHVWQDEFSISQTVKHLRLQGEVPVSAYVPVVYGCSHACTFCIIPFRRGVERSRPLDEVVAEVRGLVARGVREVTLLGQIVDRYGYDTGGPDLADLLYAVHEIEGLWRIRFLTSHPNYLSDRILDAVATLPKVCEVIEVPIQAGDDEVLARMKRGYTADDYRALIARIRERIPGAAIHTDIIVGFPGETVEQFQRTYDILAELRLDKAHLAMYSPRPGTVAARRMADDVPPEEKKRRLHTLEALQEQVVGEINRRLLGQTVEVLVDGQHKGKWRGRTRTDKLVFFSHPDHWRGRLALVRITWAGPWSMQGEVVGDVTPVDEPALAAVPAI